MRDRDVFLTGALVAAFVYVIVLMFIVLDLDSRVDAIEEQSAKGTGTHASPGNPVPCAGHAAEDRDCWEWK